MSNRKSQDRGRPHPIDKMWFLPKTLFMWCNEIVKISRKTVWTQEMNYTLPKYDKVDTHKDSIINQYEKRGNLLYAIMGTFWRETLVIIVAQFILSFVLSFGTAQTSDALKSISTLPLSNNFENVKKVAQKMVIGSLLGIIAQIGASNFEFYSRRVSLVIRSSLFSIMQDKIMKFSCLNSDTITQGFIADLTQVDVVFLNQIYYNIYQIFGSVVGLITSLGFLIYYLGFYLTLMYFGVLIGLLFIYYVCYSLEAFFTKKYLEAKDKRMSLFRNILENMDYVKINGLENYFCLEMFEKREGEIYWMKALAILQSLQFAILGLSGIWIPSMVFNAIWLFFPVFNMDLAKFYQFNTYNTQITSSFFVILSGYNYYLKMMVSVRRIEKFLQSSDEKGSYVQELVILGEDAELALKLYDGNFKWRFGQKQVGRERRKVTKRGPQVRKSVGSSRSLLVNSANESEFERHDLHHLDKEDEFMLRDINLSVRKGEKIGVIGRSSSGTSSLLYAMIGEMVPVGPAKLLKRGSVSYLSQGRWLMGGSVKENILLGKAYDEKLMAKSLEAADLLADLGQFTDGIETILSDNGDSVSGGQRARIALARCFYQE